MDIKMIGTGSAFAKKYYNNNALLSTEQGTLLIDCGITAPMALHHLNVSLDQIDAIFITHLHADHIGGLEEIAYRSMFSGNKKIRLLVPAKILPLLWDHALKAGLATEEGSPVTLETYFDVEPIEPNSTYEVFADLHIEALQTKHVPGKTSYSLILNNHIFYSADVRFQPELLREMVEVRKCAYLLHDCQLVEPPTVHATLSQLLTLPEEIQDKIWLMHYGDDMPDYIGKTGKMRFMEQHKKYTF